MQLRASPISHRRRDHGPEIHQVELADHSTRPVETVASMHPYAALRLASELIAAAMQALDAAGGIPAADVEEQT